MDNRTAGHWGTDVAATEEEEENDHDHDHEYDDGYEQNEEEYDSYNEVVNGPL